jgi:hypothetical protein
VKIVYVAVNEMVYDDDVVDDVDDVDGVDDVLLDWYQQGWSKQLGGTKVVARYNIPMVGNQFDIHGQEQEDEDRVVGRREEVEVEVEVVYKMVAGTTTGLDKAEVGNLTVGVGLVISPAWFVTEQVLLVQAHLQDSVGRPFDWLVGLLVGYKYVGAKWRVCCNVCVCVHTFWRSIFESDALYS